MVVLENLKELLCSSMLFLKIITGKAIKLKKQLVLEGNSEQLESLKFLITFSIFSCYITNMGRLVAGESET